MKNYPSNILIVKTSALGDIIQSFPVLNYLKGRFPGVAIDWVVEESLAYLVSSHPLIDRTVPVDFKGLRKKTGKWKLWKQIRNSFRSLRKQKYDWVVDLQGNCKSGLITYFSRGEVKIGFGKHSVREWPNLLASNCKYEVDRHINIRLQYLQLIQRHCQDLSESSIQGVSFLIQPDEKRQIQSLLTKKYLFAIMVCPGSKWVNKQIQKTTLIEFLKKIQEKWGVFFFLVWGSEEEKKFCKDVQTQLSQSSLVIEKLSLPGLQNFMNQVDLVIAVDSSALHLCGTTSTPSFSVFGPTSPDIFKPLGSHHFAFKGKCPYGMVFSKTCPILRSCTTGACIRSLQADDLFPAFANWWGTVQHKGGSSVDSYSLQSIQESPRSEMRADWH